MSPDARGWRIALVPDALLAATDGADDRSAVLRLLDAHGYGLLQLPPAGGADPGPLLAVIADQVAEYAHHGYAVVAVGLRSEAGAGLHWRRLAALLRARGVAAPPRVVYDPTAEPGAEHHRLAACLAAQDVADEEKRTWRV